MLAFVSVLSLFALLAAAAAAAIAAIPEGGCGLLALVSALSLFVLFAAAAAADLAKFARASRLIFFASASPFGLLTLRSFSFFAYRNNIKAKQVR